MAAAGPPGCKKDDGKPRRQHEPEYGSEADAIKNFIRDHMYHAYFSLSDSKYSGVALLVHNRCEQPTHMRYSLDLTAPPKQHDREGRVIRFTYLKFPVPLSSHVY